MRVFFTVLAILVAFPVFAGGPDLSSPPAAIRSYVDAIKSGDVDAAKRCWIVDDNNSSGSLDVIVGMWIASRKLVGIVQEKYGADGVKLLGRWNRPAGSNTAIDLTRERLATADSKEFMTYARVTISWQPGDGDTSPAFLYTKSSLFLRRVDDQWKLDANVFTGVEKASEFFGLKSIWSVCRDEMAVMNDLAAAIEKGEVKDLPQFERELKAKVADLKAKYDKKD